MENEEIVSRLSILSQQYHSVHQKLSDKYHFDEWRDATYFISQSD